MTKTTCRVRSAPGLVPRPLGLIVCKGESSLFSCRLSSCLHRFSKASGYNVSRQQGEIAPWFRIVDVSIVVAQALLGAIERRRARLETALCSVLRALNVV